MKRVISFVLTLTFIFNISIIPANAAPAATTEDFRGVWVSSVINIDFPSKPGLSNDAIKKEIDYIVNKSADIGLNAIMLQVRPTGDALYKSDIFPWSEYLTGSQGTAPKDGFDPLTYWIEQSHNKGIELHAWINPYRVSHSTSKRTSVDGLSLSNPARKNPSWVVAYKNGLYYDPGLPETKKLVIDGVSELVKNYNIDGIHLDDYFYPGSDFPDSKTYEKYGGSMNLGDWRRENVNEVIKGIGETVNQINPDVKYGVSPFAIWQNKSSSALGSDTQGAESYKTMYADTRRWVKEGWVEYICPQIYWYIGFDKAAYEKVLMWWEDVCEGTSVDLYIGQGAYREAEKHAGWKTGELITQLKMNEKSQIVDGSIFFSFKSLEGTVGNQVKEYYANANQQPAAAPQPTKKYDTMTHESGITLPANIIKALDEMYR